MKGHCFILCIFERFVGLLVDAGRFVFPLLIPSAVVQELYYLHRIICMQK